MGLFETLTNTAGSGSSGAGGEKNDKAGSIISSPATLPTVVQMYSGSQQPILLDASTATTNSASCTPSTVLTYQALQVGALPDDSAADTTKASSASSSGTIHVAPDVGVWNCRVSTTTGTGGTATSENALVDALLAQAARNASTFCWTVDLTDASTVEPNINLLQSTLVRHLIEHPPSSHIDRNGVDVDPAATLDLTGGNTKTTSLYDLQAVQFGLATDDPASNTPKTVEESSKDVKVSLIIVAMLPSPSSTDTGDAYMAKQAEALVMYHLRKFTNAVHAALCFVPPLSTLMATARASADNAAVLSPSKQEDLTSQSSAPTDLNAGGVGFGTVSEQPTVSYDKLIKVWRDLAMGIPVWQEVDDTTSTSLDSTEGDETSTAEASASALYGPGKQQEDLIETLLLRNANYPGHWEASKDSLWVALPSSAGTSSGTGKASPSVGDECWLTELRESIASALPAAEISTSSSSDAAAGGDSKKDDAGDTKDVTDFFQSLISSKK
jgi:hypothetical protein